MSRVGRLPIVIPEGVTVTVDSNNKVVAKGPMGELEKNMHKDIKIVVEGNNVIVTRPSDNKLHRALHGTTRAIINNMVIGVSKGYKKTLELVGVGYRAEVKGKKLVMNLGYSHPVEVEPVEGVTFEVEGTTKVHVKGIDKEVVGAVAADVRKWRKPEPYKGKGIKYENEVIRRKEGKTGK
ncbi:50S ribosomal protein L6 [Clostridium tepidiprofundi DSM 19306]|uniref:Large ribosomal subunit protein uL6 n=1 Tax=Clostridium tepidiprofundi DSM 19306 TaxID=1121338 RepID=A0A151B5V1_9CLOT|nr:50S ribosomal protein L6 [Clostridium tepidiprofundi]KYH35193.1 50S ribosomal protein L6 [Clostridium tepidiprofundi DSM 19306]